MRSVLVQLTVSGTRVEPQTLNPKLQTRKGSYSSKIWELPKIRGTLYWGLYNKDPTISGTILGSPISETPIYFRQDGLKNVHVAAAHTDVEAQTDIVYTCGLTFRVTRFVALGDSRAINY